MFPEVIIKSLKVFALNDESLSLIKVCKELLGKLKNENIRGVIFDLGYSYTQIKDPQKGLSFDNIGKLNMQLGLNSYSAQDVINKLDEKELEKIFKFFGDETEAKLG